MTFFGIKIIFVGSNHINHDHYYYCEVIHGSRKGQTLWARNVWQAIKFVFE